MTRDQQMEILRAVTAARPGDPETSAQGAVIESIGESIGESTVESTVESTEVGLRRQRWGEIWDSLELPPPPALEEQAELRVQRALRRCRREAELRAPLRWSDAPRSVRLAASVATMAATAAGLALGLLAVPQRPSPEVADEGGWARWSQVTAATTLAEVYAGEGFESPPELLDISAGDISAGDATAGDDHR